MKTLGGLGLGLSIVFGFLLLALVAEIYYLLRWKNQTISNSENGFELKNYTKELFIKFLCFKKANQETVSSPNNQDLELGSPNKDLFFKTSFSSDQENMEAEFMRLHNHRFLFTIKEETKEDLESESRSRKSSRTRSLSDLLMKSPPPLDKDCSSYTNHGFNPLFESNGESGFNRFRSSPPPKFKFLRDAEEKLVKKLMEESERNGNVEKESINEDSFVKLVENRAKTEEFQDLKQEQEQEQVQEQEQEQHFCSGSSQVLPLDTSPTGFRPVDQKTQNRPLDF